MLVSQATTGMEAESFVTKNRDKRGAILQFYRIESILIQSTASRFAPPSLALRVK